MSNSFSGSGSLSGLGSFLTSVASAFALLASKIIGYKSVTSVPVQKNSLIAFSNYGLTYTSKTENPYSWEESVLTIANMLNVDNLFLARETNYDNPKGLMKSTDGINWTQIPTIYDPYSNTTVSAGGYEIQLIGTCGDIFILKRYGLPNNEIITTKDGINYKALNLTFPAGQTLVTVTESKNSKTNLLFANTNDANYNTYYYIIKDIDDSGASTTGTPLLIETMIPGTVNKNVYDLNYEGGVYAYTLRTQAAWPALAQWYIKTSSDLITWNSTALSISETQSPNSVESHTYRLTSFNGKFIVDAGGYVGIENAKIAYSDVNNINWQIVTLPSVSPELGDNTFLEFNDKLLIISSRSNGVLSSTDAINWTVGNLSLPINVNANNFIQGIATVDVPLAGGSSYYTTTTGSIINGVVVQSSDGGIAFSTNGTDWSYSGHNIYLGLSGNIINANNKIYSFTGTRWLYSTNGIDWTRGPDITGAINGEMGSVQYVGGKYLAVGSYGRLSYSTDAENWTHKMMFENLDPGDYLMSNDKYPVIFGNDKFVYIDSHKGRVLSSSDGIDWTMGTDFLPNDSDNYWNSRNTIFADGKFVTVDLLGQTAYSTDGNSWTLGTNLGLDPQGQDSIDGAITYDAGVWMLVTRKGKTAWSTNGITWSLESSLYSNVDYRLISKIYVNDGKYIAYGHQPSSNSEFLYSTNGISWTLQSFGSLGPSNYQKNIGSIFGKNVLIIENGQTKESVDLLNWSNGAAFSNPLTTANSSWGSGFSGNYLAPDNVSINTLVEVQVSIGDQGSGTAEVLSPVSVYQPTSTVNVESVTIKNTGQYSVSFDLAILDSAGYNEFDFNSITISDRVIQPGETLTELQNLGTLSSTKSIVILPSSVDVLEVKVYGTES